MKISPLVNIMLINIKRATGLHESLPDTVISYLDILEVDLKDPFTNGRILTGSFLADQMSVV